MMNVHQLVSEQSILEVTKSLLANVKKMVEKLDSMESKLDSVKRNTQTLKESSQQNPNHANSFDEAALDVDEFCGDEDEDEKELQRKLTGDKSSNYLFNNGDKESTTISTNNTPDREETSTQPNPDPDTNLNPKSDQNQNPNLNLNPKSDSIPSRVLKWNPKSQPNPEKTGFAFRLMLGTLLNRPKKKKKKRKARMEKKKSKPNPVPIGPNVVPTVKESIVSSVKPLTSMAMRRFWWGGVHREPPPQYLPCFPPSFPFPLSNTPWSAVFSPPQHALSWNRTKAKTEESIVKTDKSSHPNRMILIWPHPKQVSSNWPISRKDFNEPVKYTPNFTSWATIQRVRLRDGRGKRPLPQPSLPITPLLPLLPILPRPLPCSIEVYREWFYVAMRYWHPFNEEDAQQIKRDRITRFVMFVMLLLYPQFSISATGSRLAVDIILSRYGEHLTPRKIDHRVTHSPLGGFLGSLTFVPITKFLGTGILNTIQIEMVVPDRIKYIEEAHQRSNLEPMLKEYGSLLADQTEVRKFGVGCKNNGGRLLGMKDISFLRCDVKLDWKGLFFLEANWEVYARGHKQFIFFWGLALEKKGTRRSRSSWAGARMRLTGSVERKLQVAAFQPQ